MPLITFEGVEGSGKTTQLSLLGDRLSGRGTRVLRTREPGGTEIGRNIREILMDPSNTHLDYVTEWLLYEADRRQHVQEVLKPALATGAFVLCDRYCDATEAYQLAGRGVEADAVRKIDAIARDGISPDLTLVYDLDPRQGLARAWERDGKRAGRFEAADLEFHGRVRRAYLEIARREPQRVVVLPAGDSPEQIFERTWTVVAERFGL
jgi:dTMP kinase